MPRRRGDEVVIDPVAAAKMLLAAQSGCGHAGHEAAGLDCRAQDVAPWADPAHDVLGDVRTAMADAEDAAVDIGLGAAAGTVTADCALGHPNALGARFCAVCGLGMDAPAPAARVSLEDARPKPAGQLTAEERAARDQQHAEALRLGRELDSAPVTFAPPAQGETVVIHFIDDGFTFAGLVWYRGQEIEIGPDHPRWAQARGWIMLTRSEQIERYGKQFFDRGPWPGRGSYLDGADGFQMLATEDKKGKFAGPGEEALRKADEAERRRGRAVPAPLASAW